jgi:hypothetical protein
MRVTIPDDLADALQHKLSPAQDLDKEVTRLLGAAAHVPAGGTVMILNAEQLNDLARRLGRPSLKSYADLVGSLDRLAALSFGHVRMNFSPGQLEEIEHRATREGIPVAEYAARVIRSLTGNFFTTHPARDEWPDVEREPASAATAGDTIEITT